MAAVYATVRPCRHPRPPAHGARPAGLFNGGEAFKLGSAGKQLTFDLRISRGVATDGLLSSINFSLGQLASGQVLVPRTLPQLTVRFRRRRRHLPASGARGVCSCVSCCHIVAPLTSLPPADCAAAAREHRQEEEDAVRWAELERALARHLTQRDGGGICGCRRHR